MNPKQLHETATKLFGKRTQLLSLWQEIASNFYPERAYFTTKRTLGMEFAVDLMTSYPILARRDLGNTLGTMLRPTAKEWFHIRTEKEVQGDIEGRRWLEWAETVQRRAMYDRSTQFVRASKEGDHDFAAFGQCCISVELNRHGNALLYRCWHLRDLAWAENEEGKIGQVYRKWKPTVRDLVRLFGDKVDEKVKKASEKDPFEEVDCMHMVVESDMFDGSFKEPYVSIYYDIANETVLEAVGLYHPIYVIPRWQTVSGSQYAYSPATVAALPDARLIQAMTSTLLEAGEKLTNPPMIGVEDAIRSDISIYAGGFTSIDADYDERTGEALRPMKLDVGGMPIGIDMARDCRAMIAEAFYLNKFTMPQRAAEMTAFEVGQRVQEYIRQALPIFEPMEMEYNGAVCEATFDLLQRGGAFGSPYNMPKSLRDQTVQFRFESPLHDAIEAEYSQKFLQGKALLADAAALDPTVIDIMDVKVAVRDALLGAGLPATWQRSDQEMADIAAKRQQAQNIQQTLATLQQGAGVAKTLGDASQSLGLNPAIQERQMSPSTPQPA